jgi:uncharacterized protein (TIGR03435 family)
MRTMMIWVAGFAMLMGGALHAQEKDLSGNWQGTMDVGKGVRVLLKISKADAGGWKGQIYNVDQAGPALQASGLALQGTGVSFTIKQVDVTYAGTLSADGSSIAGTATQNGQAHPLNLAHVSDENAWAIPAPPKSMPADAKPKFDVVTVKPSDPNRPGKLFTIRGRHLMTINTNVNDLVTFAYGLHVKQIVGAPDWFSTDKFDVDGVPDIEGQPSAEQMRLLVQDLLTKRFQLTFHHDEKELNVYALTVAKTGPKMAVTAAQPSDNRNFMFRGLGKLVVTNNTMEDFCRGMQGAVMDKPVVDQTGLKDRYDFNLNWTPDQSQFSAMGANVPPPNLDDPNAPPSLYTALQEELGLKMEPTRAKADAFVIDHVEKPSAN